MQVSGTLERNPLKELMENGVRVDNLVSHAKFALHKDRRFLTSLLAAWNCISTGVDYPITDIKRQGKRQASAVVISNQLYDHRKKISLCSGQATRLPLKR